MNLIYTFTKKLNESNLDLYVQLWCDSYLNNKKYHNIKLYTDDDSVDLFKNVFEDIEILNTNNVKFLDDLKILAFEKCSLDDVLIDGDIYLQDTLIKPNYSICCDVINSGKFKQNRYYKEIANALVTEGINDIIPNYSFREIIPNIGLLSIDNIEEKNKFINNMTNITYNKTKIIATIGPATWSYEMLKKIIKSVKFS